MADISQFPIGTAVTLNDLTNNPHPILHKLRTDEPVSWLPTINGWLITRRDDAIAVMRDAKTYTVDHPNFSTAQVVGQSMLSLDGDEHVRHRTPFERPFRKQAVQHRFNNSIIQTATQLLDGFIKNGHAELRRDYAGPIAVKTMIIALGMEETAVSDILNWYDTIVAGVTHVSSGKPIPPEARTAFAALRKTLLPALRRDPHSSLLAAAGSMANRLSKDQIISNAAVLLFGGIETTEGMISNAFYHLLTHPAVLEQARANPNLLPAMVEESLRLEPAAAVVDRYATRDVQLRGVSIKKDDLVQVSLAGANRDPETFPNPDQFDPFRPNLRSHITFAQGPHVCLGLHLARLEAHHALDLALAHLPNLQLDNTQEAVKFAQPRGLIFRKPKALYVNWHLTG